MPSERQIELGSSVDSKLAKSKVLKETNIEGGIDGLNQAIPDFTEVNDFTTFRAKYAWQDGNLIVQFFITKKDDEPQLIDGMVNGPGLKNYWLNTFPISLNRVAKAHFMAEAPRIQAKWTEMLTSWWFKAQGYGDRIDPDGFAMKFLELLDQDLDQSGTPDGS